MCAQLPTWLQYSQALLTPAIALLAVSIGLLQWRTAHLRAVLDLFDRRLEIFTSLNAEVAEVAREGRVEFKHIVSFARGLDLARFLFREEVTSYLEKIRIALIELRKAGNQVNSDDDKIRAAAANLEAQQLTIIASFYEEISKLMRPYMKMHQKAPPF